MRREGTKKGPTAGTGGAKSKGLQGRGPTPKASDRTKAARRAGSPGARTNAEGPSSGGTRSTAPSSRAAGPRRFSAASSEFVAGRNPVLEALQAGMPAKALYIAMKVDVDDRIRDAIKDAASRNLPLMEVPRHEIDRMANGAVHQGVVLQIPPYEYAHPGDLLAAARDSGRPPLIVALDGVTDPRNLGAVIRSTAAFGGHGVVVPERRAAGVTAGAWKASAGAATRIPVARASNLTRALLDLKQAGCFVVGLDADGDVELPDLELATSPLVIVAGSEGKGLSRLVRQTCDAIVSIPMFAGNESLNAGVATGVALYEVARRRGRH